MTAPLADTEYQTIQDQLQLITGLAADIDPEALQRFIDRADRSDAIGPVLYPSEWMRGHDRLRDVIDSARALSSFAAVARRIREKHEGSA